MSKNYIRRIIKLKKNLMQGKGTSFKFSKSYSSVSSEFYKMKNKEVDTDFEKNINQILEYFYDFKKVPLNRSFLYRELEIDGKNVFIAGDQEKIIEINKRPVLFKVYQDKSLNIICDDKEEEKIKSQKIITKSVCDKEIIIKPARDVEIDGIYENFNFEKFDPKEIICIYKNIKDSEIKNFNKVVIEIKLNRDKINELISQLSRDKEILEKFYDDNFLYIGIINSKSVNFQELKNILGMYDDFNFMLFGVINSQFAGKDTTKYHDWDEMKFVRNRLDKIESTTKKILKLLNKKTKRNKGKKRTSDDEE
jgi:hypothetical protein